MTTHKDELDVLEQDVRRVVLKEDPYLTEDLIALIQRLRKLEADLFLSNQLALEDWTSSRQRIAALERVRDAAEQHTVHADRTSAADLVAALEALRLTENATTHKGNKTQSLSPAEGDASSGSADKGD